MNNPRVSIVMPVYNSENFVRESIQSLLDQTFRDFELIIVDDGSTDSSPEIISEFKDSRIRILKNDKNRGIVYSRNLGLAKIKGEFFAPFDSDDIARNDKFEKQVEFLEKHIDFALVGSWARLIDKNGTPHKKHWKLNSKPEMIPSIMLFRNYFVHSSVLIRSKMMGNMRYTPGYDIGEDYFLLADLSFRYPVYNYPAFITNYRIHQKSAMRISNQRLFEQDNKVYRYLFGFLNINLSETDLNCIFALKGNDRIIDIELLHHIHDFLIHILNQNMKIKFFSHTHLQKSVANRWLKACFLANSQHVKTIAKLISSPLTRLLLKA